MVAVSARPDKTSGHGRYLHAARGASGLLRGTTSIDYGLIEERMGRYIAERRSEYLSLAKTSAGGKSLICRR
ncbi:MAG: hypothetical protein DME00_25630 [Candidatus Rokuibacteriota bacterium]|nr:MAG: hypothetical protein DME00_25630 [Candidatus Rokubacteria bacterium]